MTELSDLGVLGLAVMGAKLARNTARKGFGVALYNRHGRRTDDLVRDFGHEGRFTPAKDLKAFVAALAKPRVIILMVQAGKPVDDGVKADTARRIAEIRASPEGKEGMAAFLEKRKPKWLSGKS